MKRRDNKSTYRINVQNTHYLVTLTRLKNDYYGNGRFEANIIDIDNSDTYITTYVYRFGTHYGGDKYEAEWIANQHHEAITK